MRALRFTLPILALLPQAALADVTVPLNEVRQMTFARPVSSVFVGNPTIADINMIDTRHGYVLGKSFGATNIIAVDATGAQVSNQQVLVGGTRATAAVEGRTASAASIVTLNKGRAQMTLSCTDRCETVARPGDSADAFGTASGQVSAYQGMSQGAAQVSAQQPGTATAAPMPAGIPMGAPIAMSPVMAAPVATGPAAR